MTTRAPQFTHVDANGDPGMIDIHAKSPTARRALAEAVIRFPAEALETLRAQSWHTAKGPVRHTAIIAGTQAVKRTADLIPFCHPLPIEGCRFEQQELGDGLRIRCEVITTHKTGVEMEALTGAAVAALAVIDMCKAVTPYLVIEHVRLLEKSGGKREIKQT